MSAYLDSVEQKLRAIYSNTAKAEREDKLVNFMRQYLWFSYKNGLTQGKNDTEQELQEQVAAN